MDTPNILLGSVILLYLLFIPGIVFTRFYYTGFFSKQYLVTSKSTLSLLTNIIPSFLIEVIFFYLFVEKYELFDVNLKSLGILIYPVNYQDYINNFSSLKVHVTNIFLYNVLLLLFAAILGFASKVAVRWFRLDRKIKLLRFQNHWHYFLRGEILDFINIRGDYFHIQFTVCDILTQVEGRNILYSGILEEYNLTNTSSGLDNIILSDYRRKVIYPSISPHDLQNSDLNETKRKYLQETILENPFTYNKIRGRLLLIPYKNIVNINVIYWKKDKLTTFERFNKRFHQSSLYFLLFPITLPTFIVLFFFKYGYSLFKWMNQKLLSIGKKY